MIYITSKIIQILKFFITEYDILKFHMTKDDFRCDINHWVLVGLFRCKNLKCSSWSKKNVEITFRYEFFQITHPKSNMAKPEKSDFSWKLGFSILIIGMSSYKDEFLSVRTHPSDVKKHLSTIDDDVWMIYELWKNWWNFGISKIFFSKLQILIFKINFCTP